MSKSLFLKRTPSNGFVLVTALMFLMVLTMLGLLSAQVALDDKKIARSSSDYQLALRAAELAVLDAEFDLSLADSTRNQTVDSYGTLSDLFVAGCGTAGKGKGYCQCDTSSGASSLRSRMKIDSNFQLQNTVSLGEKTSVARPHYAPLPAAGPGSVAQKPIYMVEQCIDYAAGGVTPGSYRYLYRITAKGYGSSTRTNVMVEEIYRPIR